MSANKDEKKLFKQLFQIGLVVKDMDKPVERFTQLGLGPFQSFTPPPSVISYAYGKPNRPVLNIKKIFLKGENIK